MQIYLYGMLVTSSIGFAAGSFFLKRFADHGTGLDLAAAFSIFALANLAYARVLAHGLSQGAVLSSAVHLILMCGLGVFVFGERFGERQFLGMVCAIMAASLISMQEQTA